MKLVIITCLIVSTILLQGQDSTKKQKYPTFQLDEVEVTDSRTGIQLKDLSKQVTVAMVETFYNMLAKDASLASKFTFVVADECHIANFFKALH